MHSNLSDSKFRCQSGLRNAASRVSLTDSNHLALGKFSLSDSFTLGVPALGIPVSHVVSPCSEEQMGRIDAGTIVAGVTYKHSSWDFAVGFYPRKSVRSNPPALVIGFPISVSVKGEVSKNAICVHTLNYTGDRL